MSITTTWCVPSDSVVVAGLCGGVRTQTLHGFGRVQLLRCNTTPPSSAKEHLTDNPAKFHKSLQDFYAEFESVGQIEQATQVSSARSVWTTLLNEWDRIVFDKDTLKCSIATGRASVLRHGKRKLDSQAGENTKVAKPNNGGGHFESDQSLLSRGFVRAADARDLVEQLVCKHERTVDLLRGELRLLRKQLDNDGIVSGGESPTPSKPDA